jgi:hypothetical protein
VVLDLLARPDRRIHLRDGRIEHTS